MITLHSVTKELGKGALRKRVLDEISWEIPALSRYVILGHRGAGKTTLLNIMNGSQFPTSGWVERRGAICPGQGLMRGHTLRLTPRQIATRLARLYQVAPDDIVEFVLRFANVEQAMDIPVAAFSNLMRRRLSFAFIYAIPFDFYLFDGDIGIAKGEFRDRCRQAFDLRCKDAGVIVTTSAPRIARQFDGIGGVLHNGKIRLFGAVEEAISIFEELPPPDTVPAIGKLAAIDEEEEEWL